MTALRLDVESVVVARPRRDEAKSAVVKVVNRENWNNLFAVIFAGQKCRMRKGNAVALTMGWG